MTYSRLTLNLAPTSPLNVVFNIEHTISETTAVAIWKQLQVACLDVYQRHIVKKEIEAYAIHKDFIKVLAEGTNRPAFLGYNTLFMPSIKDSLLTCTHHMVELLSDGLCIGVDIAARQHLGDDTVAEITLAKTHQVLDEILLKRFQLPESCLVNERGLEPVPVWVNLLRQNRIVPALTIAPIQEETEADVIPFDNDVFKEDLAELTDTHPEAIAKRFPHLKSRTDGTSLIPLSSSSTTLGNITMFAPAKKQTDETPHVAPKPK